MKLVCLKRAWVQKSVSLIVDEEKDKFAKTRALISSRFPYDGDKRRTPVD